MATTKDGSPNVVRFQIPNMEVDGEAMPISLSFQTTKFPDELLGIPAIRGAYLTLLSSIEWFSQQARSAEDSESAEKQTVTVTVQPPATNPESGLISHAEYPVNYSRLSLEPDTWVNFVGECPDSYLQKPMSMRHPGTYLDIGQ